MDSVACNVVVIFSLMGGHCKVRACIARPSSLASSSRLLQQPTSDKQSNSFFESSQVKSHVHQEDFVLQLVMAVADAWCDKEQKIKDPMRCWIFFFHLFVSHHDLCRRAFFARLRASLSKFVTKNAGTFPRTRASWPLLHFSTQSTELS